MKVQLDTGMIKTIDLFQNLTGSHVLDCMNDSSEIYFVVAENQYGLAVGKNGSKIRNAERVFKKSIRIFEFSSDLEKFIRNMIPEAQEIIIKDNEIQVRVKSSDRAKVIGRGGSKIRIINHFLKRLHEVENLKVK